MLKIGRVTSFFGGALCLLGAGCGANDSSSSSEAYPYAEANGLTVCSANNGESGLERYDFGAMDKYLKDTPELFEAGQARGVTGINSCESARVLNELQQDYVRSQMQSDVVETGELAVAPVDKIYEGVLSNEKFVVRINNGSCSGSLIGKHWALSAAHCFPAGQQDMDVQISTGEYVGSPGSTGQVVVIQYPGYNGATGSTSDLALIYSRDGWLAPANSSSYHVAMFGRRLYTNATVTLFGYGANAPDWTNDGKQHSTSRPIKVDHDTDAFFSSYVNPGIGRGCKGDSGGPAVVLHGTRPIVAGVYSWMARTNGVCPNNNGEQYYRQTGTISNWIMSTVNSIPNLSSRPADRCIRVQPSSRDYTWVECTH